MMKRLLVSALLMTLPVWADPCGMVPPISLGDGDTTITRVGEQKTYVFYKDGIETIVIHPGFEGNVDEFGMLIPFPEPPALRKVSDNTFAHLLKAIDPPVVDYWVGGRLPGYHVRTAFAEQAVGAAMPRGKAAEVRVINEEAVGMYEVAVLEAGSAAALKRWMDDHGFRFPDGMESTCGDYIKDKWCFVAVKTRVGQKSGVSPRAGMRSTSPNKPKGAPFKGKVQAMGFRFHSETLEVPMRLSAFNGDDLHNIVYLLAEEPLAASNLPKTLVKRQMSGEKLYKNLTEPLPYKIRGGTEDDMSPNDWKSLDAQRDPTPHSAAAAELFASDLFVVGRGELSDITEEKEKALLDIGERLNLRGGSLDTLHTQELAEERKMLKAEALDQLKGMHLTVIDGDFPREVLSSENIKFQPYRLQARQDDETLVAFATRQLRAIFS